MRVSLIRRKKKFTLRLRFETQVEPASLTSPGTTAETRTSTERSKHPSGNVGLLVLGNGDDDSHARASNQLKQI